jgi:hypothetical protein
VQCALSVASRFLPGASTAASRSDECLDCYSGPNEAPHPSRLQASKSHDSPEWHSDLIMTTASDDEHIADEKTAIQYRWRNACQGVEAMAEVRRTGPSWTRVPAGKPIIWLIRGRTPKGSPMVNTCIRCKLTVKSLLAFNPARGTDAVFPRSCPCHGIQASGRDAPWNASKRA